MDETLASIVALPLENRRVTAQETLRIEDGLRTQTGNWFLDFTEIRQQGPGKCAPDRPIEDFDLADDEGFGEETAAYFHSASGFLGVQYNHRGAKARVIQAYLHGFARTIALGRNLPDVHHGFNLATVLRQGAFERFNGHQHIRGIEISISVPMVQAEDRGVRSLAQVIETGAALGATNLNLELTVGRERQGKLNVGAIRDMVSDLLPFAGAGVKTLAVRTGSDDGPSELIDLLSERLERNIHVPSGDNSRRPDRGARWRALEETLNEWHANGELR
jgi:hypothetical protein